MTHILENIAQFYSKLNEFYNLHKYTDISIQCENTIFPCHRNVLAAACPYFDSLFSRDMNEHSQIRPLQLKVMKAVTFQAVLQFIYTGDTAINSDNIYNLIVASDLLGLYNLGERCIQYLKTTSIFTTSILTDYVKIIYYFEHRQEHRFFNVICDQVIGNLELFLESEVFPEFPFWFLHKVFLDSRSAFKTRKLSPETVKNIIARWINHSFQERQQYSNILFELTKFKDPSLMQVEPLSLAAPTRSNTGISICSEYLFPENKSPLKIFVNYRNQCSSHVPADNYVEVFEVDENITCFPIHKFPQKLNIDHKMRCVAIDNAHLFCLNFYDHGIQNDEFQFSVCTSIDERFETILRPPAITSAQTSRCYELSKMNNNVLYHDQLMKQEYPIYWYNAEINTWSHVPKMIDKKIRACVVFCNDTQLLYSIGGQVSINAGDLITTNSVQAYDFRMKGWLKQPATNWPRSSAASCYVDKGKIFVSGGDVSQFYCELYDPVAGKWQKLRSMIRGLSHHRMVQYRNQLFVVGGFDHHLKRPNQNIDFYDRLSNKWSTSNILEKFQRDMPYSKVLDAVVFEPTHNK